LNIPASTFDKVDVDQEKSRSRAVFPSFADTPVYYSNSDENLEAAVQERVVKKERKPTLSEHDKWLIRKSVTWIERTIFRKENIVEACKKFPALEQFRSSKWSTERFQRALEGWAERPHVLPGLKGMVKNEPMPSGKAPRMIINEGDIAQVASLYEIGLFEHIFFEYFEPASVKHQARADALNKITERLNLGRKSTVVEGDGSAWDSCCNPQIRDLIENVLIDHLVEHLLPFIIPDVFTKMNRKRNRSAYLRLRTSARKLLTIRAIRRSGHRGTSVLNYLINIVLWSCALTDTPESILDLNQGWFHDKHGNSRHIKHAFEGDDSILAISGAIGQEQEKEIEAFWERAGFNMKLKLFSGHGVAEFCGVKFRVGRNGLVKGYLKDVKRTFLNCVGSVSPGITSASEEETKIIASSKAMSLAIEFMNVPTIGYKFYNYSKSLGSGELMDEERRKHGNFDPDAVEAKLQALEGQLDFDKDAAYLSSFEYKTTPERLRAFHDMPWEWPPLKLDGAFAPVQLTETEPGPSLSAPPGLELPQSG
jgi:hypothetical protein